MSLSEVAAAAGLARPTARRLLLTLEELGYVRSRDGGFALTPQVLTLGHGVRRRRWACGTSPARTSRRWWRAPASRRRWPSSTARTSSTSRGCRCPKIIALRVEIGTRFPAPQTSQGKVLLAALPPEALDAVLADAQPLRAAAVHRARPATQLDDELARVRARGWALADEELAPGVRSVAVPVRDGTGAVRAAMNVTVHAAETSTERLLDEHLPLLLRTAGEVSADWALWQRRPHVEVARSPTGGQPAASG